MSVLIAVIFSRVTFGGTNTGNVAAPPVLWNCEKKLACYKFYVPIHKAVCCVGAEYIHVSKNKMPIKRHSNLPREAALVYSSIQLRSSALLFTDSVKLTGAHLSCHVACFSLPPFHVYAAVMIINRNIKASGAILVCDNPHTLVSTTLTCRYHGNASYVIMPAHPADIESHCMSTPAYSGNVTC